MTVQSESHQLMMNGVATSMLVSTSIHYGMISSIYIRVSHHLARDLVGHNWLFYRHSHINGNCVQGSKRTNQS